MSIAVNYFDVPAALPSPISLWWRKLAYRHKSAEFLMYFMFVSGLLLWDVFAVQWSIVRWVLLGHMVLGATVFTVIVGAFWSSHRRLLNTSKKAFLRCTGRVIEWTLLTCTLSGFYLSFWGNTGNDLGWVIENLHFYTSWILVPMVFRHAMRWSIINLKKIKLGSN